MRASHFSRQVWELPSRRAPQLRSQPACRPRRAGIPDENGGPGALPFASVCAPLRAGGGGMQCLSKVILNPDGTIKSSTTPRARAADLRSAYNLPSTGGTGTIAIVDANDEPQAEDAWASMREYGLPACTTANGCFKKAKNSGQASPLPPTAPGGPATSRPRHGERRLSQLQDHPGRGRLGDRRRTWARGERGREPGSQRDQQQLRGGKDRRSPRRRPVRRPPGRPGDARPATRRTAPSFRDLAVRARGRRHDRRQDQQRRGWSETAWNSGGAGAGVHPKPSWQMTPAATSRTVRTSRRSPTPHGRGRLRDDGRSGWSVYGGTSVARRSSRPSSRCSTSTGSAGRTRTAICRTSTT